MNDEDDMPDMPGMPGMPMEHVHGENCNHDHVPKGNLDDLDVTSEKLNICYVRVSTQNQKDDLERQKLLMKTKYPTYIIIEDIGSGLNLNKKPY